MEQFSFLVALLISIIAVPFVKKFSIIQGKFVAPRDDRWHRKPTPSLGGIGMFLGFTFSIVIIFIYKGEWSGLQNRWSLLIGTLFMFGLGLYDDFKRLSPPSKLAGQIFAATVVIFFGNNTINFFPWPIANILLTFFWLVGITNAINLLDNMDGLAGGVSLISGSVMCYFFWRSGDDFLLIVALSLVGAILGFLVFNFPPAKIFMGDSGSMFLGFTLASLSIARRTQASNVLAIVGVPTLLFLLPILDTTLVTVTRLLRGQSPALGGTDHTSHRLIAFGLSERQAVLIMYGIALISGLAAAGLEALDYDLSLVLIPLLLIVLSLFAAYLARMKFVTAGKSGSSALTRIISNLTYKRRMFEILLDLMLIGTAYYLAFWTRFGLDMTSFSMALFLQSWPIALMMSYLSFSLFRIYRGMWKYVGISDLIRYTESITLASVLTYIIIKVIYPSQAFSVDVFLLFAIYLFLGMTASRSSFQLFDRIYNRNNYEGKLSRVLLYGADDSGEITLRWLMRNPQMSLVPQGFLDDDPYLWGQHIHDVEVLGGPEQLLEIHNRKRIDEVVITSNSLLTAQTGRQLVDTCHQNGIKVSLLKLEIEAID